MLLMGEHGMKGCICGGRLRGIASAIKPFDVYINLLTIAEVKALIGVHRRADVS
jgi:hypothetical protein